MLHELVFKYNVFEQRFNDRILLQPKLAPPPPPPLDESRKQKLHRALGFLSLFATISSLPFLALYVNGTGVALTVQGGVALWTLVNGLLLVYPTSVPSFQRPLIKLSVPGRHFKSAFEAPACADLARHAEKCIGKLAIAVKGDSLRWEIIKGEHSQLLWNGGESFFRSLGTFLNAKPENISVFATAGQALDGALTEVMGRDSGRSRIIFVSDDEGRSF